ncbi:AraC family transcriptional regulator [Clostridium sp. C105KSO13]|uniref:AraC family transcriptional regulator n=1 Tax=Clostridium sp. C105KSO13 TaxID=1776045 RepID=UPI0007407029|nr:AraC family transcriptional regulator [Clostridium sp. C105KSO13]CUX47986.1 Arabinose operon regulatory protein [Clostridium sp. C105KSO13]
MEDVYKHSYKAGENLMTSLSVYNVGHQKCEPGYQWGPGVRNHYCIHHIISGRGYYIVNGKTYHLFAGDTFILYPDTEVRYYADIQDPWEYAWVGFMGGDAASIIHSTGFAREHPVIYNDGPPKGLLYKQLTRIYEVKGNSYEAAAAMTGALYTLLATFMQYAVQAEQLKDIRFSYVEKAKAYISTGYSYPISIEEVADYVGISRSHLYRVFRECLHLSPKEYLSDFRIKQASRLLKETTLSIAAIAYSVGFESNLYFSKAFKKHTGQSPSKYRRNYLTTLLKH